MTKAETLTILEILQTTYPRFYQNTKSNELKSALELWSEIFADDDIGLVKLATKSLIQHLEFPPTIADVRKEMERLQGTASNESLAIDEWNKIRQAIKSSGYYAEENYNSLPEIAKRYVGSPQQLRDWAMSEDFNADVAKGQFLKQYEVIKERQKYSEMIKNNPQLNAVLNKNLLEAKDETKKEQEVKS